MIIEEEKKELIMPQNPVWGFWATLGFGLWVIVMNLLCETIVLIIYVVQKTSTGVQLDQNFLATLDNNGFLLSLATIVAAPVCVGLIVFIVKLKKGASLTSYLAMKRTGWKAILIALGILIVFFVVLQSISSLINYKGTNFTEDLFKSAGSIPLLWLATVVFAPVFEEALFRGFLFEGFSRSRIGVPGAVLLTSLFWAGLHLQYDLFAMGSIFVLGIIIALVRYRTGSIWSALAMHMGFNFISMLAVTLQGAGVI